MPVWEGGRVGGVVGWCCSFWRGVGGGIGLAKIEDRGRRVQNRPKSAQVDEQIERQKTVFRMPLAIRSSSSSPGANSRMFILTETARLKKTQPIDQRFSVKRMTEM